MADEDFVPPTPSLQHLLTNHDLKWVFVGGKGGVGKTTTSCSLAVQLAKHREKVLVVSTDPAHNLSDAFNQKMGSTPRLVDGFTNLFCLELEPKMDDAVLADVAATGAEAEAMSNFAKSMKEMLTSLPGIDEIMALMEVLKHVQNSDYACVVFDTAPTGHTLRMLGAPTAMGTILGKVEEFQSKLGGMIGPLAGIMGVTDLEGKVKEMSDKLTEMKELVFKARGILQDAEHTTFIPVCIPEFLSLYETERLVQELTRFHIDVDNVVVNQVLPPTAVTACGRCSKRLAMQAKYLNDIADLYEDYHVVKTPLLDGEVRGVPALRAFGGFLTEPYNFESGSGGSSGSGSGSGSGAGGSGSGPGAGAAASGT